MIQLHKDYLLFETSPGKLIPCSAELVAVELIGADTGSVDPELVQQAAAAVLHYFREDLGCTTVTVAEFACALEQALQSLGIRSTGNHGSQEVRSFDLRQLSAVSERALELSFFPKLRDTLRARLGDSPQRLQFYGLRACVKQLVGAKRWSHRCQTVNDQIVEYLRACLELESRDHSCDLVIR